MPSHPTGRLHGLDTLRVLAIALVMLYHAHPFAPERLDPVCKFGWMGVDLFFVLSGYLVGRQLLRSQSQLTPASLLRFYWRRSIRVLPAFFAVLALYYLWPGWREAPHLAPFWQYVTFTYNLTADYAHHRAFSHVWSLCIEEQFYLVLPFVLVLLACRPSLRSAGALAVAVLLAGLAWRTWVFVHVLHPRGPGAGDFGLQYIQLVYYPTWSRMDGLLAGVLLAAIQTYRPAAWARLRSHGVLLFTAAILAISVSCWLFLNRFDSTGPVAAAGTVIGYPLLAAGLAALLLSAVGNGPLGRWRIPGSAAGASLAYSLYLTHKEILHWCEEYLPARFSTGTWIGLAIFVFISLLVATVLYFAVERPCLKLRDKGANRIPAEVLRDPAI